tara:strand:- start:54 stop:314 length:261 start_codon:yes stop_codon:yes gene_type:complete
MIRRQAGQGMGAGNTNANHGGTKMDINDAIKRIENELGMGTVSVLRLTSGIVFEVDVYENESAKKQRRVLKALKSHGAIIRYAMAL